MTTKLIITIILALILALCSPSDTAFTQANLAPKQDT